MSTVERKEYQETQVMRTVTPIKNWRGSAQNLAEFDHNLDYLLEDLQNSVSRPGSSLGTYQTSKVIDSSKTNSLNRFTNVKSSNPVTEYSSDDAYNYTSPDGTKHHVYKKESYSYKTTGGDGTRMQNNINQLDSLLDDLQQVKNGYHSDTKSYNSTGGDPEIHKRSVHRELHYGDTPRSSSKTRTYERSERESSLSRDIQYTSEGYGQLRAPSPSSRSSTLSKQTKVSNVHSYPLEVVETTSPDINPEILAHLDPSLHPPGNTKVTTTIKTYTYEIPGSGNYTSNFDSSVDSTEKYVYSPNQTQSTPSKSFVYKKMENKSENTVDYPLYQKPAPPGGVTESVTTRVYQPGYNPEITKNQSYVYNETTTTRKVDDQKGSLPRNQNPPHTYIEERHNFINNNYAGSPPTSRKYIKEVHDSSTSNVRYPPEYPPNKTVVYRHETHTTNNYGPGGKPRDVETFDPKQPPYNEKPVNIQYRYKSESTTTNNYKAGYPHDDNQPLLPKPFPNDNQLDGPPKRLDELLADIGNEPPNSPYNASFNAHEQELQQKKKIETLKRQQEDVNDLQQKEPIQKTKNVSGPPVYYPPGHEMFANKEEGGAWRAEGGYQKASGNYKYEAESKSKSKSKSGAAVVPVCLPLCCGLPCTIL